MQPRYLYRPRYHNHRRSDFIRGPRHTRILIERTSFVTHTYQGNNTRYHSGPRAADVQQVTRQPVQVYQVGSNVRGADHISNNVLNTYRPAKIEQVTRSGTRPAPAHVIPAPQPVNTRGDVKTNWDQPRPFRREIQKQDPAWDRPFIRNAPPYNNQPSPSRQPGNPSVPVQPRQQPVRQPNVTRRQNNPAPAIRQPHVKPAPVKQPQQPSAPAPGRR